MEETAVDFKAKGRDGKVYFDISLRPNPTLHKFVLSMENAFEIAEQIALACAEANNETLPEVEVVDVDVCLMDEDELRKAN